MLIGLFVLCMAFTEGTGNDWLGIATIDGYHTSQVLGAVTLDVFLAAMTLGRWFGPGLLDRFGRVPVLRVCAATALAGLLVVVFGHVYAARGARRGAVGAGRLARLPDRHERGGRRPAPRRRAGQRGRVDRPTWPSWPGRR